MMHGNNMSNMMDMALPIWILIIFGVAGFFTIFFILLHLLNRNADYIRFSKDQRTSKVNPFKKSNEVSQEQIKYCSSCGARNIHKEIFCFSCGAKI